MDSSVQVVLAALLATIATRPAGNHTPCRAVHPKEARVGFHQVSLSISHSKSIVYGIADILTIN
jgi:hypothetical protein